MLKVKLIILLRLFILAFYLVLSINFCIPADPNFKTRPLNNDTYTGFISREFFQVVVTVKLPLQESPLSQLRKQCKNQAKLDKDNLILPILVSANRNKIPSRKENPSITSSNQQTNNQSPSTSQSTSLPSTPIQNVDEKVLQLSTEDILLFRSDFSWFLDSMQLYMEDYSQPDKCIFVFRKIEKDLYKKVENTKLPYRK